MTKITIVDYELSRKNPGISSLAQSVPRLVSMGYEVEFWGHTLGSEIKDVVSKHTKIPFLPIPLIGMIINWGILNFVGLILKTRSNKKQNFYLTTGGHFIFSNAAIFQFYNKEWYRIQSEGVVRGNDANFHKYRQLWGILEDYLILALPYCSHFLSASDAIRDDLKKDHPNKIHLTLPNAVDKKIFNPKLREQRTQLRKQYGIDEDAYALAFVSQGHYTRKGFWLALKALQSYRDNYPKDKVKFLVLGGTDNKLEQIRSFLGAHYQDWQEWVEFTGWTDKVQEYMALSDALFFPSYFEAFSLVEIEAAAMRLPLILTKHHGSEMIMNDGVNGYYTDFDVESIVSVLKKLRDNPLHINEPDLGRALSLDEWATAFCNAINIDLNSMK